MGLNLLQIGGDTWNRCGRGWLNIDGAYDAGDAPGLVEDVPITDASGRHVMRHEVTAKSRLPFANNSVRAAARAAATAAPVPPRLI